MPCGGTVRSIHSDLKRWSDSDPSSESLRSSNDFSSVALASFNSWPALARSSGAIEPNVLLIPASSPLRPSTATRTFSRSARDAAALISPRADCVRSLMVCIGFVKSVCAREWLILNYRGHKGWGSRNRRDRREQRWCNGKKQKSHHGGTETRRKPKLKCLCPSV